MDEHSERYFDVYRYYKNGLWNKIMVQNAIGRWITEDEYNKIMEGGMNA